MLVLQEEETSETKKDNTLAPMSHAVFLFLNKKGHSNDTVSEEAAGNMSCLLPSKYKERDRARTP